MLEKYISFLGRQPIVCAAVFITIVPATLILFRKAYFQRPYLILLIYLIIKLLLDLIMFHYAANRTNNLFFDSLNAISRYCFLSSLFLFHIESKLFRRLLIYSIFGFILFSVWDIYSINSNLDDTHDYEQFRYSLTIECILMIFWIMLYFYETIRSLKIPNLLSYPFFWVSSGMLLYYSSVVFITPLLHYAFKWNNVINLGFLMYIPSIFESVCMIFFSIGIWFFSPHNHAK